MPGIWTAFTSYRSISRHRDWIFRIGCVLLRPPEIATFLTSWPRTGGPIPRRGIAQTKAVVLTLAPPPPANRQNRRIAAYPRLATGRLHSRHRGSATQATMCTGKGLGCPPMVRPHVSVSRGGAWAAARRARVAGASRSGSLSPLGSSVSAPVPAGRLRRRVLRSARGMSPLSKLRQRRTHWTQQATQRAAPDRDLRQPLRRVKPARARAPTALTETQARRPQLEPQSRGRAGQHTVDRVCLARPLV